MYFNSSEHFPDLNKIKTKLNEALLFELFQLMAKYLKTMRRGRKKHPTNLHTTFSRIWKDLSVCTSFKLSLWNFDIAAEQGILIFNK